MSRIISAINRTHKYPLTINENYFKKTAVKLNQASRVEVWQWNFVKNVVKKIFTAYFLHLFAVNAVNYLFSPRSHYSYRKQSSPHGFQPLTSCTPAITYSTAPTLTYCFNISCWFKSNWVNFEKQMPWIFVRNALNFSESFCKKCGNAVTYSFSPHSPLSPNFLH